MAHPEMLRYSAHVRGWSSGSDIDVATVIRVRRCASVLRSALLPLGLAIFPAQVVRSENPPIAALKEDRLQVRDLWWNSAAGREWARQQIEALNAELLANPSATSVLDMWCSRHGMAPPRAVIAEKMLSGPATVPDEIRRLLAVGVDVEIRHRRVRLSCEGHVLSEADNWYVPSRIPGAMNKMLDESDISFGRVAAPLDFHRRNLAVRQIWSPGAAPLSGDQGRTTDLFEHRALLVLPKGQVLALVHETYKSGILEFSPVPADGVADRLSEVHVPSGQGTK